MFDNNKLFKMRVRVNSREKCAIYTQKEKFSQYICFIIKSTSNR